MRNIILLMLIIFWWFLLSTVLAYIAVDDTLDDLDLGENNTYDIDIDTDAINISGEISQDNDVSAGDIVRMSARLFLFRIPNVHPTINFIIKFVNWVLLIILAILIYRLASPLTGG